VAASSAGEIAILRALARSSVRFTGGILMVPLLLPERYRPATVVIRNVLRPRGHVSAGVMGRRTLAAIPQKPSSGDGTRTLRGRRVRYLRKLEGLFPCLEILRLTPGRGRAKPTDQKRQRR